MKRIKVGIFGMGVRGRTLASDFMLQNCDIVAVCECRPEVREKGERVVGKDCAWYESFDEFIKHDMDAVLLANFFPEHAPYAIQCLERGIHVLSECLSNGTMAEGVELIRAAQKSNAIYMLLENYPQMVFNREMQRVCRGGTLGKILYAEGEYNHPGDPDNIAGRKDYTYFEKHWRNYLPRTYYITHSLGPVMRATGATPKTVTAFAVYDPIPEDKPSASFKGDSVAMITTQNDDGSVFRVCGCGAMGGHHNSYRICGNKGQIENLRGTKNVMLRYNSWNLPEGMQEINMYEPVIEDKDNELIQKSGHGGADFVTIRMFLDCIRNNKKPEHPFDVYSAVAMASVAILAHRSALEGGKPYEIPDFREEKWVKMYENDRLAPFYGPDGSAPTLPCCVGNPNYAPTEKQLEMYRESLK